eukprot:jgi/Astpho2/6093/Aster-04040
MQTSSMIQRLSMPHFTRTTHSQRRNMTVRAEEQPPLPPVDPQEKATKGSTSQAIKGFEERVDQAGREISKATQESSGLTQEATTIKADNSTEGKLKEAMAFSGPAPELINSRAAMLAMAAAFGAEVATAQQLRQAPIPVAISMIVITLATLVPILKGEPQGGKGGVFSSRAEKWNGRLAMLGLVILLAVETFKGGPAFR